MSEKLLMVSADAHAGAPSHVYLEYFDKETRREVYWPLINDERMFQHIMPALTLLGEELTDEIDDEGLLVSGRNRGDYDIKCRLEEMDREGIAAEVIFPGAQSGLPPFVDVASNDHPARLRDLGTRAYHRWMVDHIGDVGKGRVLPVAYPQSGYNLDESIKELRWCKDRGFVAVNCPTYIRDPALPPLYDPRWDSFWQACVELELPVTLHAGFREPCGSFTELCENLYKYKASGKEFPKNRIKLVTNILNEYGGGNIFAGLAALPRRAIGEMVIGGVFDRFPKLKFVPTEVGVDWIPTYFAYLDKRYDAGTLPKTKRRPSEYWQLNGYAGATHIRMSDAAARKEVGVDKMMFGRDYPHPEGTWPNSYKWLQAALEGYTEEEARLLLGETAVKVYNLDRTKLAAISEKIAPRPEDILGKKVEPVGSPGTELEFAL